VFVVSSENQLARRKKLTWNDLNDVPWILNHEGCGYRSYVESRLKERSLSMKAEVEVIGLEVNKTHCAWARNRFIAEKFCHDRPSAKEP
jgi:hypothetical protein